MGAKNPEALKPDGGHIWTSGKKGDIYKDNFYYVPENFNWLGSQFRGVKPLVTGIGMKITEIVGERFNKDMTGISFKEKRNGVAEENTKLGNDVFTRRMMFERVAYYQPHGKDTWELGKGTCAIEIEVNNQRVYLFVGVAEVGVGGKQNQHGYRWHFLNDKFFNDDYNCGIIIGKNNQNYRLVVDTIGRKGTGDKVHGEKVILLGVGDRAGQGIMNFGNSHRKNPLIGVLMGIAVNLADGNECDDAFSSKKGKEQFEGVKNCLGTVKSRVMNGSELKVGNNSGGAQKLDESWVKNQLKDNLKNWNKIVRMNSKPNGTELPYKYA